MAGRMWHRQNAARVGAQNDRQGTMHLLRPGTRLRAVTAASTARPATTCTEAVVRARRVLRSLRDARPALPPPSAENPLDVEQSSSVLQQLRSQAQQQVWVTMDLPLPVKPSLLTSAGVQGAEDVVRMSDEGDWPGGMQQRLRVLRPLVDKLVEGYDCQFLGVLESEADGVGLWSCTDMTVIGSITNATFPSLLKLLEGGYGSRVMRPGHMIICINPQWSSAKDLGQPWDRSLKAKAAVVLGEDSPATASRTPPGDSGPCWSPCGQWEPVYACRMVRSSRGALGLLHRAWPGPWQVYATPLDDARELGPVVLESPREPAPREVAQALQQSPYLADMMARAAQLQEEEKKARGGWPW